ncbi:hypothetical protein FRC18_001037 [Serendipita sp. 400]|nr:hypothetical protein FRC18_001037 [Serendipita sp. 400]
MAQNLLRALRHRSTPTLLPSSDPQPPSPTGHWDIFVPSIVVSIPPEEGGGHYCAFAGSPFPPSRAKIAAATAAAAAGHFRDYQSTFSSTPTLVIDANSVLASVRGGAGGANVNNGQASLAGSFDAPLPDFAALEEVISKLRKQGETPTFRRPGSPMEQQGVVMPKRKSVVPEMEDNHEEDRFVDSKGLPSGAKKTSRPRPPRGSFPPNLSSFALKDEEWELPMSPTTPTEEVIQVAEEAIMQAMHAAQNPTTQTQRKQGLLRGFTKRRKDQQQQQQQPRASISHESVLNSRPVVVVADSPEDDLFDGTHGTHPSPSSRSILQRSQSPVVQQQGGKTKRNSLNWLLPSKKQKQPKRTSLPPQPLVERASYPVDVQWPPVPAQSNIVPAHDAEYRLPDCFPEVEEASAELDNEKPLPPIPVSQSQASGYDDAYEHVEMQIRNTPVVAPVPVFPEEPQQSTASAITPITEFSTQQSDSKERKPKRKFSLKRLREKFLSSPSTPAPPVPSLPTTVDTTKIPLVPILVITAPVMPPSNTYEPASSFPFGETTGDVQDAEDQSVSPRVTMESVASIQINHASLDEDSNGSTSSEDSGSSAIASTVSTPDSTPPDTPDSATSDGAIFAAQQKQIGVAPSSAMPGLDAITKSKEVLAGIPRSHGMRMKLDSLHFEELQTQVGNVA